MDSDSDHFESADEEFLSDEENEKVLSKNVSEIENNSSILSEQVQKIVLEDSKEKSTSHSNFNVEKIEENVDSCTKQYVHDNNKSIIIKDEKNANVENNEQEKPKRKERPQKTREPKQKLGTKLGTKISSENKNEVFWKMYGEAKKNEYTEPPRLVKCWEEDANNAESGKPSSKLYYEKSNFNPQKNFWENEQDYMELPKKLEPQVDPEANKDQSGWSSWGNWSGMSSLLSTAQSSVSSITQGLTNVIGVPDPEELAKLDKEKKEKVEDETENNQAKQEEPGGIVGFGLGNLVSGVSHITKFVETTGSKVLTGGLDTLEVIGKKTMEVLQEGDPGLKKKRALFKIDPGKPVLSQILREAKEKAEEENKLLEERDIAKKPHYETMFDDYQGLVHLEALEMLSKQCDIKLETLSEKLQGPALTDMQETMTQIKELCELPDEEEDNSLTNIEIVREKAESAINEINIPITYDHFFNTWSDIELWLLDSKVISEEEIHQKAIESLAHLTSIAVEQFHKAGELLLVKERRSTVDEADSLVQLTIILTGVIGSVAGKFSEKLNNSTTGAISSNVNSLITNIFLEAANSSSYIQDAFNLMIPVLQVGAV